MLYSVFLLLIHFLTFSSATSAGEGIVCSVSDSNLGCETPGEGECDETSTQIMWWVKPPVHSNEYSIRTGDGNPSEDPSSYHPNQYLNIHVRTLVYNMQYTGLLLYAENTSGVKVGEWSIPPGSKFWLPPECNSKAVLHRDGAPKPYHMIFGFKTPPKETGEITIRALLKYGEPFPATDGKFFWPNSEDIVLKEILTNSDEILTKPQNWFKGQPGQTCDTVCQEKLTACDQATMIETQTSATALMDAISSHYYCPEPLLSSCSATSPASGTSGCYYHDLDCKGPGRPNNTSQSIQCNAKTNDESRFCLCRSTSSFASSGRKTKPVSWLWFFAILTSYLFPNVTGPYHNGILKMFLFFTCLSFCQGHNWLNNPSRSGKISFSHPCPKAGRTHIQVGPGQKFPLEWATGHPGSREHYFVVASANNYNKLALHDFSLLKDYINNAPDTDTWMDDEKNHKYHVSLGTATNINKYESEVLPGDPLYIERPSYFANRVSPSTGFPKIFKFADNQKTADLRVSYESEKYPWIIAVYKFRVMVREPKYGDMAFFEIPEGSPSGKYIIHWMWEGYRDCVDINVLPNRVNVVSKDDIWGASLGSTIWERYDHCRIPKFRTTKFLTSCIEIPPGGNIDECRSKATHSRMTGTNVIPWNDPSPWNRRDPGLAHACPNFIPKNNKSRICYSFEAQTNTASQFPDIVKQTEDTDNPIFFGTCYRKVSLWGFDQVCAACEPLVLPPAWKFHDRCVDCDAMKNNDKPDVTPTWMFADKCIDCATTNKEKVLE